MGSVLRAVRSSGYEAFAALRNALLLILALSSFAWAEPVVVALGDSLTQGYGLDVPDGLTVQLEKWLRDNGHPAVVQNAGVSGDTTAGGLARVGWALGPDADAVIVTLGGNDLLRGIDPANSRANLDAILAEATGRGLPVLLVAMRAPGNYGADYKAAFDAIYPDLAAKYGVLLVDDFFGGLAVAGAAEGDPASLAPYFQADGIHPNPEGVKLIVAALGPRVVELLSQVKDPS